MSATTQYTRDGFGDVIQEVSPDRGTSVYYYDQASELTAGIDGRGQRVDYTRDILGRVTQKLPAGRPSSEAISYTWDTAGITGSYGVGRLSSVTDGTGTTSFAYDHRGNILTKRQTIGAGTADLSYTYDLADRVTSISYPSGRIVQYAYDTKGRVSSVQTKAPSDAGWTVLSSGYTYEPFGAVKTIAFGNGLTLTNDWGNDGRLASKRLSVTSSGSNLSWLTFNYDPNGNLGAMRDALNDANSIYYGYDANDRLTMASMVLASAPSTESYTYNAGTNQLARLTDASGTRSITYDGRGNTSGETRPGGATVSTSYDGYGRLLTYTRTGDPAQSNAYNGLDERVSATSGSVTHSFVYDADERLMGEYDGATGAPVAERIWMSPEVANDNQFGGDDGVGGYAPLALATGSGASSSLTWVHGNQLGVPIMFTDASGTAVPAPNYTLPGFPGQTRTLSDIYYNRYRDYDSSTGRYIQADAIGLGGGSNPYVYADDNPLRYTDPSGLEIGNQRTFFPGSYPEPGPPGPSNPAAGMALNWLLGSGPDRRIFGPGSVPVEEMRNAPGVNAARNEYDRKNRTKAGCDCARAKPVVNFAARFGPSGYLNAGFNQTRQFVGSYRVDIYPFSSPGGKCGKLIVLTNTSSFKSFAYGIGPDWPRSTFGPMGNMSQTYWWYE